MTATQEIDLDELQVLSRYGRDDLPGGYKQMDYALTTLAEYFFMNKLPVHLSPFQKVCIFYLNYSKIFEVLIY